MAFQKVATLADLPADAGLQVKVDGHPLCLVLVDGEVKAVYDVCSHEDYPLHEGMVWGCSIECALHGSTFDLDTGAAENLPATRPVPVFAAKLEGDDVMVDLDQQLNDAPIPEH
jgi:3-phenylpropionate/trans-cinnamate dioxygenase ferredoxin subunit